jgi:hypothetical protein
VCWRQILTLSLVVGPTACVDAAQTSPGVPALHLVRGDELVATLTDVRMYQGDSPPTSTRLVEQFYAGGIYMRDGDRVRQSGSFHFRSDEFCVMIGGREWCRSLFRDEAGLYYTEVPGTVRSQVIVESLR